MIVGSADCRSMLFVVFLLMVSSTVIESQFMVKTLPDFDGDLPFTLETGYIGLGESDDVQLFYYFIESEGNPKDDPLMLWLTGGPGCSGLSGLLYEIGPFTFNYANSTLEKPILETNPYSWTKAFSIIFLDQPVGTGFSYARTSEAYLTNDTLSAMHAYTFLRKWLVDHPKFLNNPLYVGADSYAGIVLPMILQEIYNGNEVGEGTGINIKGYLLGNPLTDTSGDYNSRIPFAHRMALLSDAIYKSVSENCGGEYLNVDPDNSLCIHSLEMVDKPRSLNFIKYTESPGVSILLRAPVVTKANKRLLKLLNPPCAHHMMGSMCLGRIRLSHILEPYCDDTNTLKSDKGRGLGVFHKTSDDILLLPQVQVQKQWCRCIGRIYMHQILEPYCVTTSTLKSNLLRRGLGASDKTSDDILLLPQLQKQGCRDDNYIYSYVWANSRDVREALHIREELGEIEWVRCNETIHFIFGEESISYTHNVLTTADYHRRFADKNCKALIYSGDHDMVVPYMSTLNWIESLNLSVIDDWKPWFVDEQVAGYTMKYSKDDYKLTYATVKGGGHTAPEFKPKECLSMLMRWLASDTL